MFLLDPANRIIYWSTGGRNAFSAGAPRKALDKKAISFSRRKIAPRERTKKKSKIALREGRALDRRSHLCKAGAVPGWMGR